MTGMKRIYRRARSLYRDMIHGRRVYVLMYHRVGENSDPGMEKLTVSAENFARQLAYFKEHFQPLRIDDDWSRLRKKGVVITFDDGYAETAETVVPLLEKYGIPATFFITTENLGTGCEFWWDRLAWDFSQPRKTFSLPDSDVKIFQNKNGYRSLGEILATFKNDGKSRWLDAFERLNDLPFKHREPYLALSRERAAFFSGHPLIDIGLHTHQHNFLGNMTSGQQRQEWDLSEPELRKVSPSFKPLLAVPYGSYNQDTIALAREKNTMLLLANDRVSRHADKESGIVGRILMPDISGESLQKYLARFI